MGFRDIRVINEDRMDPGAGFPTHRHQDMEILSYVLEGELAHRDSMGTGSVIKPGDLQRMSAGTGVFHSEFNASTDQPVHFFQIWILPEKKGAQPGYEQRNFPVAERTNRLRLLASHQGRDNSLTLHQAVDLFGCILENGQTVTHAYLPNRHGWIQVARGEVELSGQTLGPGDGASISDETLVRLTATRDAEFLLFDLA